MKKSNEELFFVPSDNWKDFIQGMIDSQDDSDQEKALTEGYSFIQSKHRHYTSVHSDGKGVRSGFVIKVDKEGVERIRTWANLYNQELMKIPVTSASGAKSKAFALFSRKKTKDYYKRQYK